MRISLLLIFIVCNCSGSHLSAKSSGLLPQDTILIDTSEYVRGDPDYNLIIAAFNGYSTEVLRLLNKGANVNAMTMDGVTPIMYSVQNGDLVTTRILVLNGADVNKKPYDGVSPIIGASRYNYYDIAEFLIQHGANINDSDIDGASPLHYAAGYYYYELSDLLLSNGANPDCRDNEGSTPLMAAVYGGNPDVIDFLISFGANINSADNNGFTPLMIAAQNGDTAMIRILAGHKADPDLLNSSGLTALAIAAKNGHTESAGILMDLGTGHTVKGAVNPHTVALENGHKKLARILNEKGLKSRRMPVADKVYISPGINTSFNDIMLGGEIGIRDSRYKLNLAGGYQVRLFAKRILIENPDNSFNQFWENRSLAYIGLSKEFTIFHFTDRTEAGLTARILGGYTFGRNYRGSMEQPPDEFKVIPSAGVWLGKTRFRFFLNLEYLDFETFKVSPVRLLISVRYSISIHKTRYRDKTISWF